MIRPILLVIAALAPVAAASAQNGALAGRSPHIVIRPVVAERAACPPEMHSLPSGKGYVYGRHALPGGLCGTAAPEATSTAVAASD